MSRQRVYFIRRADGVGPVKIGCTAALDSRLTQLCSDYRAELEVLADAPGDFVVERNVLLKFAAHNIEFTDARGKPVCEWFAPAPELMSFVRLVSRAGIIPLTTDDCRELQMRDRYLGGGTLQEIGAEFGVTRERVRQILRKTGVPSLGMRPEIVRSVVTPEIEAEIVRLGSRGKTQGEIAKALGVSKPNVCNYLSRHNIKVPRTKKPHRPDIIKKAHAVAADYLAGLNTREIAEKYQTHQPSIYWFLRIAGVKPKRVSRAANILPIAELAAEYRAGVPLMTLAAKYDRTNETIKLHLVRAGVTLRTREQNEAIRLASVAAANLRRKAA